MSTAAGREIARESRYRRLDLLCSGVVSRVLQLATLECLARNLIESGSSGRQWISMHDDGWGVVVLRVINQVLAFLFSPSNSKVRWPGCKVDRAAGSLEGWV
jgi:hypothetical protein